MYFPVLTKSNPTWRLCLATLSLCASTLFAAPTTYTVGAYTDSLSPASGKFNAGDPTQTELRGALNQVNTDLTPNPEGYIINFTGTPSTIPLAAMLPILNLVHSVPLTIDGGSVGPIVIDGQTTHRGFVANNKGTITINNFTIQNVNATGGIGGNPGGGGGMGAGAGLFVRGGATVSLSKTSIRGATNIGGTGGTAGGVGLTGGGGGLGGNGGNGGGGGVGGGGGGGLGGNGGNGVGTGGGGGGGINCGPSIPGNGGSASPGGAGGGLGAASGGNTTSQPGGPNGGGGGSGNSGSNGGGGGGAGGGNTISFNGGNGGDWGGGGGGNGEAGGGGGYGGGGGGAIPPASGGGNTGGGGSGGAVGGFGGGGGGAALGGIGGGEGDPSASNAQGGGGAGFGAIFVDTLGTLNILDSFSTGAGNAVTAGTGFSDGWAAGNDAFFLTGSNITFDPNGDTITILDSIADDSLASFEGAPSGVTLPSASTAGASITIGNTASLPGTVQLLGTSTYSGPTTVNNGTLRVDGSIFSPVTVSSGARLQGIGTLLNGATINGGGTIHAGNSPGTLTLSSLTLASTSSILELEIDLTSNASSIFQVNGDVALNNGKLLLTYAPATVSGGNTYDFLPYTGTLSGKFGSVDNEPLGFGVKINYLPNLVQIFLVTHADIIPNVIGHLSRNEREVLKYLVSLGNVPSIHSILTNFHSLTIEELRSALDSISPARNVAATFFTNQVATDVGQMPLSRFAEGRVMRQTRLNATKNSMATALAIKSEDLVAMNESAPSVNTPADFEQLAYTKQNSKGKPAGQAKTAAAAPQNYGFWASGFGDFITQDKQNSNPKINDTAAGALVGFDYYGCQNGIFNLTAGYIHNDITEGHDSGGGTSNGAVLGLYGTGYIGNGYLEGGVLGGYNRFDMHRNVVIGGLEPFYAKAESSFNNWMVMPHLGGGYDWIMNWGIVEPFAAVDWAVSFQESYNETGAFPLNMHIKSKTPSLLRSQVGLNLYETWDNEKGILLFEQSASYINKTMFNTKMHAAVIIAPAPIPAGGASEFNVLTYRNMNLFGCGTELFYKHKRSGFFVSGNYQGEFGSHYMSNTITGTLGVFF